MDLAFKKNLRVFNYEQMCLRLLNEEDLPYTLNWRNEYKEWFTRSEAILPADHFNWFMDYKDKPNDFVFIVEDQEKNRVGQVAVYNIDWEKKQGEFGRLLVNPGFSGRQHMKKSAAALLRLCVEWFQLSSLYLEVKTHNERAIHIYHSLGFIVAGQNQDYVQMIYEVDHA